MGWRKKRYNWCEKKFCRWIFGAEKGSKELREYLETGKDIIITTIQKFPYISEDIISLCDKKFAVIIVSHRPSVKKFADKIINLNNNKW